MTAYFENPKTITGHLCLERFMKVASLQHPLVGKQCTEYEGAANFGGKRQYAILGGHHSDARAFCVWVVGNPPMTI